MYYGLYFFLLLRLLFFFSPLFSLFDPRDLSLYCASVASVVAATVELKGGFNGALGGDGRDRMNSRRGRISQ